MATNIQEIRSEVRQAIDRGDLAELVRLRHLLELERQRRYRSELAFILVPLLDQVKIAIAENRAIEIRRILFQGASAVERWFEQTLYSSTRSNLSSWSEDLVKTLSAVQLRALTRLGVDGTGKIMPAAGQVPQGVISSTISQKQLLARLSPLLWVRNSSLVSDSLDISSVVLPGQESIVESAVESHDPAVSARWRDKVISMRSLLASIANDAQRILAEDSVQSGLGFIRKKLGLTNERTGYAWLVLGEMRHETIRAKGAGADLAIARLGDVVSGYRLRSRFLPTTDIVHASNDGKRWYKDNRPGSASDWNTRLIPPYRKNCVCYTQPIVDTPTGPEFHAEFGIPGDRKNPVLIRDAKTFSDWFNAQPALIQQKVMGLRRWMAAARDGGPQRYADFVTTSGRQIGVKRLLREGRFAKSSRRQQVEQVIERQSRLIRTGQQAAQQTTLRPDQEKRFQNILRNFLDKILK